MNTSVSTRFVAGASRVLVTLLFFMLVITVSSTSFAEVPKVGDKAPDFQVKALDDSLVKLSSLLKKGPVVLVVLRGWPGYQCPICTMQVGALLSNSAKFEERKAHVVLVYPGPATGLKAHANEFVTGKTIPGSFQMVLDPDFDLIKKYDIRWDAPNETSYPSTFVIDKKGKILFSKVSHSHSDRAKPEEILKALESVK